MPDFYVLKGKEPQGPFTDEQLRQHIAAGEFNAQTLSWHEGLQDWQPLKQILPDVFSEQKVSLPPYPPLPIPVVGKSTTNTADKVSGAVGMGCLTFLTASVPFTIGLLLSLTGIGAIVGIPIMLFSLALIGIGPFVGMTNKSAECPACEERVQFLPLSKATQCPKCKAKLAISKGTLTLADVGSDHGNF